MTVLLSTPYIGHTSRFQLACAGLLQPQHVERALAPLLRLSLSFGEFRTFHENIFDWSSKLQHRLRTTALVDTERSDPSAIHQMYGITDIFHAFVLRATVFHAALLIETELRFQKPKNYRLFIIGCLS